MVNATLIAEQMGIVVEENKTTQTDAFSNVITLVIEGQGKRRWFLAPSSKGRPASCGYATTPWTLPLKNTCCCLNYNDRPGMIGKIGTIMGQHDINIGSMNLGRREKKGEAMVVLSLDSPVPPVVEEIKGHRGHLHQGSAHALGLTDAMMGPWRLP